MCCSLSEGREFTEHGLANQPVLILNALSLAKPNHFHRVFSDTMFRFNKWKDFKDEVLLVGLASPHLVNVPNMIKCSCGWGKVYKINAAAIKNKSLGVE